MEGTGDVVGKLMAENDALQAELASLTEAVRNLRLMGYMNTNALIEKSGYHALLRALEGSS